MDENDKANILNSFFQSHANLNELNQTKDVKKSSMKRRISTMGNIN